MTILGFLVILALAAIALAVAVITVWSGWRAFSEVLAPTYRISPPGPGSIALALFGVALPVIGIGAFTLYLAIWLLRVGVHALA